MAWIWFVAMVVVLLALAGGLVWALWHGIHLHEDEDDLEPVYRLKTEAEWRDYWTRKR